MSESEWQTRKTRIDARLRALVPPWEIIPYCEKFDTSALTHHAVEEFPTAHGPADYALFKDGQFIGIIEAKKVTVNPQNVLEQAKRYASGVANELAMGSWNSLRVPFLYASNGTLIWFLDTRTAQPVSRPLANFHSPDGLEFLWKTDPAPALSWLMAHGPGDIKRLRNYQTDSVLAVEAALAKGRRQMLVAMATGTGKTFLTVAQIYRFLKSNFARRILFLVDRKALAAQAVREFNAFATPHGNKFTQEYEVFSQRFQREDFGDDEPFDPKVLPNEYLAAPKSSQTFVYVATIQRMARNLFGAEQSFPQSSGDADFDADADRLDIPIHAFDLIIADECHRGYTAQEVSLWRDTLNYFDAVKIGLTATPAAHTVALFGDPVFRYGVEQAIREGYLVDYEAVAIKSEVRMNGVFLKEGEQVGRIDPETGDEVFDDLEDERTFAAEEIEHLITAPRSNRQIIEEIARYAYDHEKITGRFPKILIFAGNDLPHTSHADQIVRICRDVFGQGDDFVQKITGSPSVDRPLQKIRQFRNRPNPRIVVTVDMLSTGVDIPALEFIVFLRPVKSRILWEQMLGRGTRRCDDINKTKFVVFDCFDGTLIRYFKNVSNFKIEDPHHASLTLPEVIERIWENIDRAYHTNVLVKRLRRIEKDMAGEARQLFARWIQDGDIGQLAGTLQLRLRTDFTGAMKLLRDREFQQALLDYPRARRTFLVGYGVEDSVSSQPIERYGPFEKAEDYLAAFSQFVRANSEKVQALGVLLRRPAAWGPQSLEELRQILAVNAFGEATLRRAHARLGHKPVADIISLVKNAAVQESPLLTAEERVAAALARLEEKLMLTTDQRLWFTLIREHLITSLSLAEEDFDLQPLFTARGGLGRARKVFPHDLPVLISRINEAVAA